MGLEASWGQLRAGVPTPATSWASVLSRGSPGSPSKKQPPYGVAKTKIFSFIFPTCRSVKSEMNFVEFSMIRFYISHLLSAPHNRQFLIAKNNKTSHVQPFRPN